MKKISGLISSVLLALAFIAPAQPATALADCGSVGCTVTFEYTGWQQTWTVPTGVTSVRFEVYGAAGGGSSSGAAGGLVSGTLHSLPTTLYIMVGGAGVLGNKASGGFNGGGKSGASDGSSGSGGGASEIRASNSSVDQLVVAGAGGGQGSGGGLGGLGGGLIGGVGEEGSAGAGGQGGTQSSGGLEGAPDRMAGGVAGTRSQGGVGGSPSGMNPTIGGGGGGGGYYGGGGGVGAGDPQYTGSGGGGGSSYTRPSATSNVQHTLGVRSGNGLVVLRYGATPVAVEFEGRQVTANSAEFTLDFGAAVYDLSTADLQVNSSSGCRIDAITGGPSRFTISLQGCTASPARLSLAANSVSIDEWGPPAAQTSELTMSIGEPQYSFTGNPTSSTGSFHFDVQHVPQVGPLSLDDFEILGCNASIRSVSTGTRLLFENCPDGNVKITLLAHSLSDAFGNTGPSADVSRTVRVDGSRPTLRLQNLSSVFDSDGFEQARIRLIASEAVSVRLSSIRVAPAGSCRLNLTGSGSERIFTITGCKNGTHRLVLPIGAVADSSGWLAPTSQIEWPFEISAGQAVAPTPTPPAPTGGTTPQPSAPPQTAPWIPIDMTTGGDLQDLEPIATAPITLPEGAAGESSTEADLTVWLIPAGLSLLFLLIALLLLRRRKQSQLAEDDGAAAVKKHSVFSKPANSLS